MKRTGCLICLWAAALLTLPEQDLDAAQEGPPLQRKLTVDYRGVSVVEVLKDVGDRTGARFTYADKFLEGLDLVTCEAREQEAGRILTRILMPRGLKLQMDEASLVTVVKRDPCDEFKVRRENVFEFAEKPKVTREGDRVTIAFETRAFCDVTVAIESASTGSGHSEIVRHIASGVLGDNAPEPFQWNSKKQTLSWDGKDDRGAYVDNRDVCFVRVSLGLKPQFERTLFWSPKKRIGFPYPALGVAPEGVYVAESYEVDQVRLFDHQGNYLRTIYPFPADMIDKVQGLKTHTFLQDGKALPLKRGYCQGTMLTCSDSDAYGAEGIVAVAAANGRVAVVGRKLNRLASDGSSGGLPFEGPSLTVPVAEGACGFGHKAEAMVPLSAALSPDGKWLYLAGYQFEWNYSSTMLDRDWLNGVWRMPFDGNSPPALFVGSATPGVKNGGTESGQFRLASSVACDAQGRVYVGDYMNDRLQVFDADGKHLKTIPAAKPARLAVHQKTGDIYVFSWLLANRLIPSNEYRVEATMTHLGALDNPAVKSTRPLPLLGYAPTMPWNRTGGLQHRVELDSWTDKPAIWVLNGKVGNGWATGSGGRAVKEIVEDKNLGGWAGSHVRSFEESGDKLVPTCDFARDVCKAVVRLAPPTLWRQRLYVSPKTGKLYVGEGDSGVGKSFRELVEIDPDSGKINLVPAPYAAEDLVFDIDGLAYLRSDNTVVRYDPTTWREVPWDYGQEREGVGFDGFSPKITSALVTPGHRSFNFWHLGGMDISLRGHLLVTTCNGAGMGSTDKPRYSDVKFSYTGKSYAPAIYPGRARWGESHIWDRNGKLFKMDAVPGIAHLNGVGIDGNDNIYMLVPSRRLVDGKPLDPQLDHDSSCTLVNVPAGKATVISTSGKIPVPLPEQSQPKRPPDLAANCGGVSGWVEGAEWFYGGVGFGAGACVCWNCRFALDYFARSFAPEPLHCSVAVLDSAGNLVLRVGQYGNVEDGKPLIPAGGPANPRAVGGDEVALNYACYVAAHTDRRLFIADAGNARILGVKLGYHAEEKVTLKDVAERNN